MKRKSSMARRKAIEGYIFVSPWIVGFIVLFARPLIESFYYSFQQKTIFSKATFIGLGNYVEAFFEDEKFTPILYQTFIDNLINIPVTLVVSLLLAILATQKMRGVRFFRAIYFLPVVIGSGILILRLFNILRSEGRLITIDLSGLQIIFTPQMLRTATEYLLRILINLWQVGIQVLIFIAGLQGIPPALYEAASIDGANPWKSFWSITLPILSPVVLLNAVITIVDSFTHVFNRVLEYIREQTFGGSFRFGYASALAWIYFLMILIIILFILYSSRRFIYYGGER
jgi:ABC-type sugar transport system permease subunit